MKIEKRNLNDALRVLSKVVCQTSPVELYRWSGSSGMLMALLRWRLMGSKLWLFRSKR